LQSRVAIFHYGARVFVLPSTEHYAGPIPVLVLFVQNFSQSTEVNNNSLQQKQQGGPNGEMRGEMSKIRRN